MVRGRVARRPRRPRGTPHAGRAARRRPPPAAEGAPHAHAGRGGRGGRAREPQLGPGSSAPHLGAGGERAAAQEGAAGAPARRSSGEGERRRHARASGATAVAGAGERASGAATPRSASGPPVQRPATSSSPSPSRPRARRRRPRPAWLAAPRTAAPRSTGGIERGTREGVGGTDFFLFSQNEGREAGGEARAGVEAIPRALKPTFHLDRPLSPHVI